MKKPVNFTFVGFRTHINDIRILGTLGSTENFTLEKFEAPEVLRAAYAKLFPAEFCAILFHPLLDVAFIHQCFIWQTVVHSVFIFQHWFPPLAVFGKGGQEIPPLTHLNSVFNSSYDPEYTILWAIIFRAHFMHCQTLCTISSKEVGYQATLWLHAHLHLVRLVESCARENIACTNDFFKHIFESSPHIVPSVPDVFCEDKLPNFVPFLPFYSSSDWNEKNRKSGMLHLLWKGIPQRCRVRLLVKIFQDICKDDPSVYGFVMMMFVCTVLGLYRHSRYHMSLRTRIYLFEIYFGSPASSREMIGWFTRQNEDHESLLFYIIKEYLVHVVRFVPALRSVLGHLSQWPHFEQKVCTQMDELKRMLDTNVHKGYGLFDNTEEMLQSTLYITRIGIKSQKPLHEFIDWLYTASRNVINSLFASHLQYNSPTVEEMCVIDPFLARASPRFEVDKHLEYLNSQDMMNLIENLEMVRETIRRLVPTDGLCIELLEAFKVQVETIGEIKRLFRDFYENDVIKKIGIVKLRRIAEARPYDFAILAQYFHTLREVTRIRLFELPGHYYTAQLRVLRLKWSVSDLQPMPIYAGRIAICPNCYTIKSFIANSPENIFAYGNNRIFTKPDTLEISCQQRSQRSVMKILQQSIETEAALAEMARIKEPVRNSKTGFLVVQKRFEREATKIYRSVYENRCKITQIVWIDLRGSLLQYFDKLVFICPFCASFCEYKPFNYYGHFAGCPVCIADKYRGGTGGLYSVRKQKTFNERLWWQSFYETNGIEVDKGPYCDYAIDVYDNNESSLLRERVFCANSECRSEQTMSLIKIQHANEEKKRWHQIHIQFENDKNLENIRDEWLCGVCAKSWIRNFEKKYGRAIPKKYMEHGLQQKWTTVQQAEHWKMYSLTVS